MTCLHDALELLDSKGCDDLLLFLVRYAGGVMLAGAVMFISLGTVVFIRQMLPLLMAPGTWAFFVLHNMAVALSFSTLFNLICAATFSVRLGRGVPGYSHGGTPSDQRGSADYVSPSGTECVRILAPPSLPSSPSWQDNLWDTERTDDSRGESKRTLHVATDDAHGTSLVHFMTSLWHTRLWPGATGDNPSAHPPAPPHVLENVERMAHEGEQYTPTERRHRMLYGPRRFCLVCKRYKAPREHHCVVCRCCVVKMDHHCPWINSCVDWGNQRYFFSFLWELWLCTVGAAVFLGWGYAQQTAHENEMRRRYPGYETGDRVRLPQGPFGAAGYKLTSSSALLTVSLAGTMVLCLPILLWINTTALFSNTTPVEDCLLQERRKQSYGMSSFGLRNPYDVGRCLNCVEAFRTVGDPFVMAWIGTTLVPHSKSYKHASSHALRRVMSHARMACLLAWLVIPPTLRPMAGDGMHYPTAISILQNGYRDEWSDLAM